MPFNNLQNGDLKLLLQGKKPLLSTQKEPLKASDIDVVFYKDIESCFIKKDNENSENPEITMSKYYTLDQFNEINHNNLS